MKKRILASLLSLVMALSMLPITALAAEETNLTIQGEQPAICTCISHCADQETADSTCLICATNYEQCTYTEPTSNEDGNKSVEPICVEGCILETGHQDECETTYAESAEVESDTSYEIESPIADYTWYGDGNAESFEISSAAELLGFSNLVRGADGKTADTFENKTVSLTNNIALSGIEWLPIGTTSTPFKGTFDGGECTISNLTISNTNANHQGLFGFCQNALLKNIRFYNADILCDYRGGILAGVVENSTIENVDIFNSEITGKAHIGGLIGRVQGSNTTTSITNCDISTTQISAMSKATNWDDTVENDNSNATDSTTPFSTRCGGLTSITVNSSLNIAYCTLSDVDVKSYGYAGGILGVAYGSTATTKIANTVFDGSVFSRSSNAAGLAAGTSNGAGISVDTCNVKAELSGKTTDDNATYLEYPFMPSGSVKNSNAEVVFTYKGVMYPSGTAENCEVNATFQQGSASGITSNFYGFHQYADKNFIYKNCTGIVTLPTSEQIPYLAVYGSTLANAGNPSYVNCSLMINFPDDKAEYKVYRSGKTIGGASVLYVDFNKKNVEVTSETNAKTTNTIGVLNGGIINSDSSKNDNNSFVNPTKDGAVFAGWYENAEFSEGPVSVPEANKTYYAKWIELKTDTISMEYGSVSSAFPSLEGVTLSNWQSGDTSIVSVEGNKLKANKVGTTTLTATATTEAGGSATLTVDVEVTPMPITFGNGKGENPSGTVDHVYDGMAPDYFDYAAFYPATVEDGKVSIVPGSQEVALEAGKDLVFVYDDGSGSGAQDHDSLPVNVTDSDGMNVTVKLLNPNYHFVTDTNTALSETVSVTVKIHADNMDKQDLYINGEKVDVITDAFVKTYNGQGQAPVSDLTTVRSDGIDTFTVHFHPLNSNTDFEETHLTGAASDLTAEAVLEKAPKEPGQYLMIVNGLKEGTGTERGRYAYASAVFSIEKSTVTIRPNDKTIYVGDALPELGADDYTVTGLAPGDSLTTLPTLAYDGTPDTTKEGSYAIKASGASVNEEHYTLKYEDGVLTISLSSGNTDPDDPGNSGNTGDSGNTDNTNQTDKTDSLTKSPHTGDMGNITVWTALFTLSIIAAAAAFLRKKIR